MALEAVEAEYEKLEERLDVEFEKLESGLDEIIIGARRGSERWQENLRNKRNKLFGKVDDKFDLQISLSAGHTGQALCVDSSDDMEYIVSGGDDNTARIWKWHEGHYSCYRLNRIMKYSSAVTAVAVAGSSGPVMTGSKKGILHLTDIETGTVSQMDLKAAINGSSLDAFLDEHECVDLSCKREAEYGDEWLLAAAVGHSATLTYARPLAERGAYELGHYLQLPRHDHPVERCEHIPGDIKDGAAIATISGGRVRLYGLDGDLHQVLAEPNGKHISSFAIAPGIGGWIVAGSEDVVSIWMMGSSSQSGEVLDEDGNPAERMSDPPAHVQYIFEEGVAQVAIDPDNNFIVVARNDDAMEMQEISKDGRLVEWHQAKTIFVVKNSGECNDMWIYQDPEENDPALVMAMDDGRIVCLDCEGLDAGEKTAECRSLERSEIYMPILQLLVTFFQVMSFALGPNTNWKSNYKPVKFTLAVTKLSCFDFHSLLRDDLNFEISQSLIFGTELLFALPFMVLFVVSAIWDPHRLPLTISRIMKNMREQESGGILRLQHWRLKCMRFLHNVVTYVLLFGSTVLVVTCFKLFSKTVSCDSFSHIFDLQQDDCYQGPHLLLIVASVVAIVPYAIVAIPYNMVEGSVYYMSRRSLLKPEQWSKAAERKASVVFLGPIHPRKDSVFSTRALEFVSKIMLPCLQVHLMEKPVAQALAVAALTTLLYVHTYRNPYFVDKKWAFVQGALRFYTVCASLCGLLVVAAPQEFPKEITAAVVLTLSGIGVVTAIWKRHKRDDEDDDPALSFSGINMRVSGQPTDPPE